VIGGEAPVLKCPVSNRHHVVVGVRDRLMLIKDRDKPRMNGRPPYYYQVPLEFLPKVGPKTIDKLINRFGSEMKVLHQTTFEELAGATKEDVARNIVLSREGKLSIEAGGGGVYGRVEA
jgi:PHP family Zn ribbon phosphoesterase